jgi:hypothetical protein
MGLLAGIARWRHHHVVAEDEEGMTVEEMATVLKVVLPLVRMPEHRGKCLQLSVSSEDDATSEAQEVWAEVRDDGSVYSCADQPAKAKGWGRGRVAAWIPLLLDGDSSGVLIGDDDRLVEDAVTGMFESLWAQQPF